ncbi:hypothetical protein GCM10007390_43820 [Persicitalea jodogahamensis]|uniref:Uncharacterized protein n=1 Tax=Persicitalea jodogahamensis TaxID=402147 RepID=A0A8J3GBT0_9BACT|nr:hypothetical protein GCM10007390_43820 [Persicitalea jodogahamensis]
MLKWPYDNLESINEVDDNTKVGIEKLKKIAHRTWQAANPEEEEEFTITTVQDFLGGL